MTSPSIRSTVTILVTLVVVLVAARSAHGQPAPPAFKHLEPIHADGSPAERVSPIVTKQPPVDPAPPSMGYYETRWRRWGDVIMPRLPEKNRTVPRQPEPIPAPEEDGEPVPPGETLPPLDLPPLLPNDDNGNGGIPFLPGEPAFPPPGQGEPTPADPPAGEPTPANGDLEDLFRDPLDSETETLPQPTPAKQQPPRDNGSPASNDPPPFSEDLFAPEPSETDSIPAVEPEQEQPDDSDTDLDDLFQLPPADSQSMVPAHLQVPARPVSMRAARIESFPGQQALVPRGSHPVAVVSHTVAPIAGELPAAGVAPPIAPATVNRVDPQSALVSHAVSENPLRDAGWRSATSYSPIRPAQEPPQRIPGPANPLR